MFAVVYTDVMCFTVHVTSCHCHGRDKRACSMSLCHPSISVCSLTRGALRRQRSAAKFAIEFQRLKCCVWQKKHSKFNQSESLSVSSRKQWLHNYQQLQSKLTSTVTETFLCVSQDLLNDSVCGAVCFFIGSAIF